MSIHDTAEDLKLLNLADERTGLVQVFSDYRPAVFRGFKGLLGPPN